MKAFGYFILTLVVIVACLGLAYLTHKSDENREFEIVCEFVDGNVQGDVCLKDNKVVITQDAYKERING